MRIMAIWLYVPLRMAMGAQKIMEAACNTHFSLTETVELLNALNKLTFLYANGLCGLGDQVHAVLHAAPLNDQLVRGIVVCFLVERIVLFQSECPQYEKRCIRQLYSEDRQLIARRTPEGADE